MCEPQTYVNEKLSKQDMRAFKTSNELNAEEIKKMKSRKYNH